MTRRMRVLLLPAVVTTLLADASLYIVIRAGVAPMTIPLDWHVFHPHHPLQFWVPWLLALPFIAAGGVAWSRWQGGTTGEIFLVALAPAIVVLALVILATIGDLIIDVGGGHHVAKHTFCGTAWALASFATAPGLALSVGLLAALVSRRRV
jgi:hypothetical protein